ncbi:hypothetical protein H0H81_000848 [Sphagnurus paluster]|uniref:Cytochrome P450 n=1 Tax=Sphagnurus paluster TaxID=117069 RepID=A0A9P7FTX0_9AGAR|nr:hypothetical protein H0H81_000848 [Sphagnurus paluster]
MRQIISGQAQGHVKERHFDKSEMAGRIITKWGMNLVAAQTSGDVWRKHRRIVGPAFNNQLYGLVWAETLNIYRQMETAEGWDTKHTVDLPMVQPITTKMTLLIIARCGFGFSFDWTAPPTGPDGAMTVQESLCIITDSYTVALIAPNWIETRTLEVRNGGESGDERMDTFTMLVRANEQETGKLRLDAQEVIGKVFIMLFVGHETTAHTLTATLALLAVHQDIQDEILEQIVSVVGYDRDPNYADYENLDKVLSAFYEALRLFPAAYIMMGEATQDTVLDLPNPARQEGSTPLSVAKGTSIVVDLVGIQYNPRYFKDPQEFRPSRWHGVSNESETFAGFSIGPRACIGRKFATTEAVVFLTMLLRDWRVEPMCCDGESKDEWAKRVFAHPVVTMTLTVRDAPVRLVRREHRGV